jgi:hypothetical protein
MATKAITATQRQSKRKERTEASGMNAECRMVTALLRITILRDAHILPLNEHKRA